MGRLFFFGCSYTQYLWPTWADIIGQDSGKEYYNFGLPGLGNVGIMHRMVEADLKYKFTKDDEIFVFWSSWCREDRVADGNWDVHGSVFNAGNPKYDIKFIRKYWDIDNDMVKNSTAIITANKLYGDYITWQGSSFELGINEASSTVYKETTKRLKAWYFQHIPTMPVYEQELVDEYPFEVIEDCHPDTMMQLQMVKNLIYPALGREINPQVAEKMSFIYRKLLKIAKSHNKKSVKIADIYEDFNEYLETNYPEMQKRKYTECQIIPTEIPDF